MLWVLVYCVPLVAGHGGMLWPPTWQAGEATPIEEITSFKVYSDPPAKDPKIPLVSGLKAIKELNVWHTWEGMGSSILDKEMPPTLTVSGQAGIRINANQKRPHRLPLGVQSL